MTELTTHFRIAGIVASLLLLSACGSDDTSAASQPENSAPEANIQDEPTEALANSPVALGDALNDGNPADVELALVQGEDPNGDFLGLPFIHLAATNGSVETTTLLLEAGADIEASTNDGTTALIIAAREGHDGLVEALLEAGADPHTRRSGFPTTALHAAAQTGTIVSIDLLVSAGVGVDELDEANDGPLASAAYFGMTENAQRLMALGADVDHAGHSGNTAADWARERGHDELADLLVPTGSAEVSAACDGAALVDAVLQDKIEQVIALVECGADPNTSEGQFPVLQLATLRDNALIVEALLSAGASTTETNDSGYTALMEAARNNSGDAAAALLSGGADPFTGLEAQNGRQAIHIAAINGALLVLEALIDAGVDPATPDAAGNHALTFAAQWNQPKFVERLLDAGVRADLAGAGDLSAIEYARAANDTTSIELLEDALERSCSE